MAWSVGGSCLPVTLLLSYFLLRGVSLYGSLWVGGCILAITASSQGVQYEGGLRMLQVKIGQASTSTCCDKFPNMAAVESVVAMV